MLKNSFNCLRSCFELLRVIITGRRPEVYCPCINSNNQIADSEQVLSCKSKTLLNEEIVVDQIPQYIGTLENHEYKNWVKVVLGLKSMNQFITPYVSRILEEIHWSLIEREKLRSENEGDIPEDEKRSNQAKSLIEAIQLIHRQPITEKAIIKCCDISILLTLKGELEIAKVFFGHTQRRNFKHDIRSFDFSKLMNFLANCKLSDGYLKDYRKCFGMLQIRNQIMHSPTMEISDSQKDAFFSTLLDFCLSVNKDIDFNGHFDVRTELIKLRSASIVIQDQSLIVDSLIEQPLPSTACKSERRVSIVKAAGFIVTLGGGSHFCVL